MSLALRRGPLCVAIAVIVALPLPASAWGPRSRVSIADEAVRLMPAGLRTALTTHRDPLLRGMLEPALQERTAPHLPDWRGGSLETSVARAADALARSMREPRTPFATIARQFGELAHYVADAGFPPAMSRRPDDRRVAHFTGFCESRRERFPLVFYGHDDPLLGDTAFDAFTARLAEAAAREDERLAAAYDRAGDPPDPAAFDDRSVPFAIGSLGYSRTVTAVVRAWLVAWGRNGGDTGQTPYWTPKAAASGTENDR